MFNNNFEMKKILLLLLSLVSTTLLAQIKQDTTKTKIDSTQMKQDSVKLKQFVFEDEKEPQGKKKNKKEAEKDTLSYAAEYKRDAVKFQFGIRGGLNFGNFNLKDVANVVRVTSSGLPQTPFTKDNFLNNTQFSTGYLAGAFIRMTRGSFYFQPEALYAKKAGKIDILQANGSLFKRVNGSFTTVDIPLSFGIRFRQGRVFAGPLMSFPLNFNKDLDETLQIYTANDFKNELFTRPSFGINAGLGFEFKHIFIEGRYERGLSNAVDYELGPASNPSKFQMIPSQFQITLGLIR
jgi:Outer membrane protein beta-barrel domain